MPIMAKVIMASVTYGKCCLSKVFIASLIMANVFKCYGKWKWAIVGIIRQPFVFKSPVAEFKEFEGRFKFKPRFKYGWFNFKLYQMFQDLSRR